MSHEKILKFREQLPFLKGQCFLNYAATCPVPQSSLQIMQNEIADMQEPLGKHFYKSLNKIEFVRKNLAAFLGAHPGEIAFVQNTSSAVSTIALALKLQKGDRVLVPDNEFPSNFYAWKNLESMGVEAVPFKMESGKSITEILSKQDLRNVRAISLSAVSFETGLRIDLKEFADFCRSKNIYSVVDAIQAIGTVPLNCHQAGIDFLASASQKWLLGPVGCGFIYARQEHLEKLFVPMIGWTSHKFPEYFDLSNLQLADEMSRFEPGLPNYIPTLGMGESLRLMMEFGIDEIAELIRGHVQYLRQHLTQLNMEFLTAPEDLHAGILCFKIPQKVDHRHVHSYFEKKKISVTVRGDYIRVSPHFFTLQSELDIFVQAIAELVNKPLTTTSPKQAPLIQTNTQELPVLVNGATGSLGSNIVLRLLQQGRPVHLLARDPEKVERFLHSLDKSLRSLVHGTSIVDFSKPDWGKTLLIEIGDRKFAGLINASGDLVVDLLENQDIENVHRLFDVQFFGPMQLMQYYIKYWQSKNPLGVLNVLSSSGRCGYPLLSTYASAHAALWTLTESLQREQAGHIPFMTFIAPSQHSPMQKLMGRPSLRYYQVGKSFDFEIPEEVAIDVVEQFVSGKPRHVDSSLQLKLWVNALLPDFFGQQIAKSWRR